MFPDEVDQLTEDSSLHSGRIRSFKHERGNWATYVYVQCTTRCRRWLIANGVLVPIFTLSLLFSTDQPEEEFGELLEELLSAAEARGVVLTPQEEFHLSLSQTVVLRHHWIQPFTQSLKTSLGRCRRFV